MLPRVPAPVRREIGNLALAWAATRAALLLVGYLSLQLLPPGGPRMPGNLRWHAERPAALEMWTRWDSEWYLLIAERGYAGSRDVLGALPRYREEDAAGFFPLYPLAVRWAGAALGDPVLGGVAVSNLCLLAAAWFLGRLARADHGEAAARWVPWVLFAFPTSLFLSAVYSESLFLMLAAASVWLARERRWWPAGFLGGLAALCRPLGFLLAVPVGWELARDRRRGPLRFAPLALIPAGTAAFLIQCAVTYGDFLAPLHRQGRWRGPASGPWQAFLRFFEDPEIHGAHHSGVELAAALLVLAALPFMFRRLRPGDSIYAALTVAAPLCTSLWSFGRLTLAAYPLFHLIAIPCARRPGFAPAYLSLCLPLAALFMSMFASGWWVG